jgi:hypothetical protein
MLIKLDEIEGNVICLKILEIIIGDWIKWANMWSYIWLNSKSKQNKIWNFVNRNLNIHKGDLY